MESKKRKFEDTEHDSTNYKKQKIAHDQKSGDKKLKGWTTLIF